MLDPNTRALLLENLRPPEGGVLDLAVGTTFSLDLLALLTAPLAFTWFSWEDDEGRPSSDPNALLEAIRRHADHIHIFCQAGQIKVPATGRQLFAWLESSVHEVVPPNPAGVFHPKIWAIRYRMPNDTVIIRVLCLSRNLTFDRSWDTLLTLDGVLRKTPLRVNQPLVEFIQRLPALTLYPADKALKDDIESIASDIACTEFDLPQGFDQLRFWPLGLGGQDWPYPEKVDRLLAISPFLASKHLRRLADLTKERTLVSRVDSLAALEQRDLDGFRCLVMTSDVDLDADQETVGGQSDEENPVEDSADDSLSGLHAKLLIADIGSRTHVYTGSANATSAAFNTNVEFVIELRGAVEDCGVLRMLEPGGKGVVRFFDLLDEFIPGSPIDTDSTKVNENRVHALSKVLVNARPHGVVTEIERDSASGYEIRLLWTSFPVFDLQAEESIAVWPISLGEGFERPVSAGQMVDEIARWPQLSFAAITRFFAFRIVVGKGGEKAEASFVINLPLMGLPDDRNDRVLASLFEDKDQLLRFLFLLLAADGVISVGGEGSFSGPGLPSSGTDGRFQSHLPMLETLLRALDKSPEKLDQLSDFISQLRRSDTGEALLPAGFEQIWEPLWEARQHLKERVK
tara:strand:- start:4954 stop:6840 length:1887 start_codon:yes stop_codon:yes gene_type:complete